jgi:hypothetical protein
MSISSIQGAPPAVPAMARPKMAQPAQPSPSMQTIDMPKIDSGAIVESGLERMQAIKAKFKDDTPIPRPNPASPIVALALQGYQQMHARFAPEGGQGLSIMA